jgi:scyllo-inositol 2-dehydrogenase (NADP+)
MGRSHLQEMARAGMTPAAVCEIDPERLKVADSDFPGIQTYTDLSRMLREGLVDLVTVITPHNTHARLAIQCLRAGCHVVCEKPLAISTEECDAMIAAAEASGVVLSAYHNRHWDGHILRAVEEIKKRKVIGEIVRIDARWGARSKPNDWWRTSRTISGGILYDWGVHLLEYALQLIDSEIIEVSGFAKSGYWGPETVWKKDANEDDASAIVRFRNGTFVSLNISQLDSNPKLGFLEIVGTEGTYLVKDWHGYEIHRRNGSKLEIEQGWHAPSAHERYYENIAAHLTRGVKLIITPEWARRPIHIIDLAMRSAKLARSLPSQHS